MGLGRGRDISDENDGKCFTIDHAQEEFWHLRKVDAVFRKILP